MIDAKQPVIALTMGDVAGIGPEVIARAWGNPSLHALGRILVIGDTTALEHARTLVGGTFEIVGITHPENVESSLHTLPCLDPTAGSLEEIAPGRVDARAGQAAHDYLVLAIDLALAGRIDAITTLPLNKESLAAAGVRHPGHTEILAERCGVADHAMMLYLPSKDDSQTGLGVVHATLHMALRKVFDALSVESVYEKIALADRSLRPLTGGRRPRVAVAGLNPHAGENGLFGDEEIRIIAPAVQKAREEGMDVTGPIAADTLFARALAGDFDAVVAMYHDQGHVAIKTIGFDRAVNVTLGLPIVRTSVAHGTAFDIVGQGKAETTSLISAVDVASRLAMSRRN